MSGKKTCPECGGYHLHGAGVAWIRKYKDAYNCLSHYFTSARTGKIVFQQSDTCKRICKINALTAEVAKLREALQELVDWQNGPPLRSQKWLTGWAGAMDMAHKVLEGG